jgi:hypothetical protein
VHQALSVNNSEESGEKNDQVNQLNQLNQSGEGRREGGDQTPRNEKVDGQGNDQLNHGEGGDQTPHNEKVDGQEQGPPVGGTTVTDQLNNQVTTDPLNNQASVNNQAQVQALLNQLLNCKQYTKTYSDGMYHFTPKDSLYSAVLPPDVGLFGTPSVHFHEYRIYTPSS